MRTRSSIKNIVASLILSFVAIIVGFISQKVFVDTLGLQYLGINGLFTNVVSMLGLVELGLGSAIVFHLYKPIEENDKPLIKSLMQFYKKGYYIISLVVLIIGLAIVPFLGVIVGDISIPVNVTVIYLLFLLDVVCSYLLIYKRSILYADQKNYIISSVHIGYTLIMNGLQVAFLLVTRNFYLYLLIKIMSHIVENVITTLIVNIRYPYLNYGNVLPLNSAITDDIIKKLKALFIHKFAEVVVFGSDNLIISIFLGVTVVGLFSNYYLVMSAIAGIVWQMFAAITASVGNLLVTSNAMTSFKAFKRIRFINFWVGSMGAIGLLVVMDSFVSLWLGDDFVLPLGVLISLTIYLYLQLIRQAPISFKDAAGIFHEDRHVPILESVVNVFFSIIFVQFFGLAGVFMGTICSNLLLHLYSYPKFVYTKLFERSYKDYYREFVKYLFVAFLTGIITFGISRQLNLHNHIAHFVANLLISVTIPNLILYVIYRNSEEFAYFKDLARKIADQAIQTLSNSTGIKRANNICSPFFKWLTTAIG